MKTAKKFKHINGVRFEFANDTKLDYSIDELSADMIRQLAIHGMAQKIGDSYAGADSVTDAIAAAEAVWANLTRGVFNSGGGGRQGGILAEAIARVTGREMTEVVEMLAGKDDKEKRELRKVAAIKAEMLRIEMERAKANLENVEDADEADLSTLF